MSHRLSLVTGASGYVGGRLVRELEARELASEAHTGQHLRRQMSRIEEDADWVTRILAARQEGDTTPFAELVDRFAPRVLSVLRGLLAGEADAEDVSQDVFVKVYRSLQAADSAAFRLMRVRVVRTNP